MDWFQYTKKTLRKSKFIQWIQLTFQVPAEILTAQLLSEAVSYAVGGQPWHVARLGACILCIVTVEKLIGISIRICYGRTSSTALHACKMELFRQFLSNPLDVLSASDHGAATERFQDDFNCITARELSVYPSVWTGLITAAAYFGYLSYKNPLLALCMAGISILQAVPPIIIKRFLQVNYDACREIEEELSDFTAEGYYGFAAIKLYGLKEWWLDKLKGLHGQYLKIGNRSEAAATADRMLKQTVENILKYGTYAMAGIFILSGHMSMQDGVAAIALSSGFYAAVSRMAKAISELSVAKVACKRLSQWLPSGATDEGRKLKSGGISIRHLSFSYGKAGSGEEAEVPGISGAAKEEAEVPEVPGVSGAVKEVTEISKLFSAAGKRTHGEAGTMESENAINGISAEFSEENISVIKGRNGIGKSTLLKAITGLVPSEKGAVLIGGEHPCALAASQFPYALCYLPQEDASFDFTAMELYQMLLAHKISHALSAAAQFGLAEDTVRNTKIRELSGGEKKKVFLALAFSFEPLILLLDEPTNSLDQAGKDTLKHLLSCRGRGAVIITHDAIFDDIADKIYFLDKEGMREYAK